MMPHLIETTLPINRWNKKLLFSLVLLLQMGCAPLFNRMVSPTTPLSGKKTGPAKFSPDGNEIVFSAEDEGEKTSHIYKANVDGTGLTALTTSATYDYGPVFSPDGNHVVFSSMADGKQGDLWLMRPDGSDKKSITSGPGHDYGPIFSRDGDRIFFIRAEYFGNYSPIAAKSWHEMDIYSVRLDGTNLNKITSLNSYRIGYLSVTSDDSGLIAQIFSSEVPDQIWMIPIRNPDEKKPIRPELDGFKSHFLFFKNKPNPKDLQAPSISPDGKELLFSWDEFSSSRNVYLMDIQSKKVRKITNMKSSIFYPHFSMDGSKIIFQTTKYVTGYLKLNRIEPTIWVVNKDGSDLKAINFKQGAVSP